MTTATAPPKPAKIPEKADPTGEASTICPACDAKLVFRGCKALCLSPQCVYRIVATCSDN